MPQTVLNVGGGGRTLPAKYDGWTQTLYDIDPECKPDICADALELEGCYDLHVQFDAVYCSHTLEHFPQYEVPNVLDGFLWALKPGGFVEIHTPNLNGAIDAMRAANLDINDVWYRLGDGSPITFHDTLFGWGLALQLGKSAYAHRCAFTARSLHDALLAAGFERPEISVSPTNLQAIAYAKDT